MEGRGGDIYFGSKITHNEQNETTTSPPEYETIAMWNFDTFPRASGIRRAFSIARRNESGQQAWEPGGVGEKATYRHTSNPLIL